MDAKYDWEFNHVARIAMFCLCDFLWWSTNCGGRFMWKAPRLHVGMVQWGSSHSSIAGLILTYIQSAWCKSPLQLDWFPGNSAENYTTSNRNMHPWMSTAYNQYHCEALPRRPPPNSPARLYYDPLNEILPYPFERVKAAIMMSVLGPNRATIAVI